MQFFLLSFQLSTPQVETRDIKYGSEIYANIQKINTLPITLIMLLMKDGCYEEFKY